MLVCAIAAALLIDTRQVLPKNPCSIAAVVSLLADSEFMDPKDGIIPPGAEWMSDEELEKSAVFTGYRFRMGWFGGPQETSAQGGSAKTGGSSTDKKFKIDIVDSDDSRRAAKDFAATEQKPLVTEDVVSMQQ